MLAEFCRHTGVLPHDFAITDCPSSGKTCVILTVRTERGGVEILVWQWRQYFALGKSSQKPVHNVQPENLLCRLSNTSSLTFPAEGVTFNLLDRMDGNVPAVVSGGVLRVDPSGILPDAPENIHTLWEQAETTFFQRYMHSDPRLPQAYLEWDQRRLSGWWTQTRESQERQQREYRREISRLAPQVTPAVLSQYLALAEESVLVSRPREQVDQADQAPIETSSSSEWSPLHVGGG